MYSTTNSLTCQGAPVNLRGARSSGARSLAPARRVAAPRTGLSVCAGKLALLTQVFNLPHPDKMDKGGEDAWFVSGNNPSNTGGGAWGIADGVGGFNSEGVDAGLYAKAVMLKAMEEDLMYGASDPRNVMDEAHQSTRLPGACTCVVAGLDPGSTTLKVANLGDSGFRVFRNGRMVEASKDQQHYFDCPYQLCDPQAEQPSDFAKDADMYNVRLQPGDMVIAGTDGVWDNVYNEEVTEVVQQVTAEVASKGGSTEDLAYQVARDLTWVARKHAEDDQYLSPYAEEKNQLGDSKKEQAGNPFAGLFGGGKKKAAKKGPAITGGKLDDITCLCSIAVDPKKESKSLKGIADGEMARAQELAPVITKAFAKAAAASKPMFGGGRAKGSKEEQRQKSRSTVMGSRPENDAENLQGDSLFTEAEVMAMEKQELMDLLTEYGLPCSGRTERLQQRVLTIRK